MGEQVIFPLLPTVQCSLPELPSTEPEQYYMAIGEHAQPSESDNFMKSRTATANVKGKHSL